MFYTLAPKSWLLSPLVLAVMLMSWGLPLGASAYPSQVYFFKKGEGLVSSEQFARLTKNEIPYPLYQKALAVGRDAKIFRTQERYYLSTDCGLNLFYVEDGQVKNAYKGDNFGYFCGTTRFYFHDTIWSFGGYGFWRGHATLSFFQSNGEWSIWPTSQLPHFFMPSLTYYHKGHLYAPLGLRVNQADKKNIQSHRGGYVLDLSSQAWSPITIQWTGDSFRIPHSLSPLFQVETQGFLLFFITDFSEKAHYLLLEKSTGRIFEMPQVPGWLNKQALIATKGDTLYTQRNGQVYELLLSSQHHGPLAGKVKTPYSSGTGKKSYLPWGLTGGGLIILWLGIYFVKRLLSQKKKKREDFQWAQKLMPYAGQDLSVSALDEILGLNYLTNEESRRAKRAHIIRTVGQGPFGLNISRKRADTDRRYFHYHVSKSKSSFWKFFGP